MKTKKSENVLEILKIGSRAVKKAQAENKRKGLPNVYSKNKKLYFELPDGTITMKDPMK